MKILVVGSGGREHALAWRLAQSPGLQKVYVAPGNAGTAREHELENLPLSDIEALADYAEREKTRKLLVWILWATCAALVVLGTLVIFTFDPCPANGTIENLPSFCPAVK